MSFRCPASSVEVATGGTEPSTYLEQTALPSGDSPVLDAFHSDSILLSTYLEQTASPSGGSPVLSVVHSDGILLPELSTGGDLMLAFAPTTSAVVTQLIVTGTSLPFGISTSGTTTIRSYFPALQQENRRAGMMNDDKSFQRFPLICVPLAAVF